MIKFALICENGHQFDSWFQSGAAYDVQAETGLILCPVCQASLVTKAIMAPAIASKRGGEPAPAKVPPQADTLAPEGSAKVALFDERDRELRAMIEGIRQRIFDSADDVGASFPEEARKIHDGLIPERPIHGQASFDEARALIEEGIGILPIPLLPDEHN